MFVGGGVVFTPAINIFSGQKCNKLLCWGIFKMAYCGGWGRFLLVFAIMVK